MESESRDVAGALPSKRIARAAALLLPLAALLLYPPAGWGQYVLEDVHDKDRYNSNNLILPFVFYSQAYRFGGGIIYDSSGLIQPQSDEFGAAIGSANGSYGMFAGEDDVQLRPLNRLFLDSQFGYFQFQDFTAFIDGNPRYRHQTAGTNRSSQHNFFINRNVDVWGHLTFKYLLPIGGGRGDPIAHYVLENGLLKSGATGGQSFWNPLASGRSYVQLTPFVEDQSLETPAGDVHRDENGVRLGFVYDNSDFTLNPSYGNVSRVILSRDFGLFRSTNPWTNISGEYTQYLDLGNSSLFRQQVVALDFWTSYSVTWSQIHVSGRRIVSGAPPFYDGAVLGGTTRLRGYPDNRYWDRAAVYTSAELRLVPNWNPLRHISLLKPADITWMQWVLFAEAGRVASKYSPSIFSHLKGDVGVGLRILANDTLVRIDVAASHEGFSVYAALNQPF